MDFAQAEALYRELEEKYRQGEIDSETYRQRLGQIRVRDAQGRTWMLQEGTGRWYLWNGKQWEPGIPPGYQPQPPVAKAPAPPSTPQPTVNPQAQATTAINRGTNVFGFIWRLALVIGIWVFVTIGLIQAQNPNPTAILVWIGVGILFIGIILWQLTRVYEGVIENIRIETEQDTDEDGTVTTTRVTYAYIRTTNGKIQKVKARRGFQQGDRVYKRKGDWSPRKIKA